MAKSLAPRLLSVAQAAERKAVSRSAVYRALQEGRLSPVPQVTVLVLDEQQVDKWEPRAYRDRPGSKGKGGRPKLLKIHGSVDEKALEDKTDAAAREGSATAPIVVGIMKQ